jgi:hypothetical protein
LILPNGKDLCATYNFVAFETLECTTIVATVVSSDIKFVLNGVQYGCANSDTTKCKYQTTAVMPAITTLVVS